MPTDVNVNGFDFKISNTGEVEDEVISPGTNSGGNYGSGMTRDELEQYLLEVAKNIKEESKEETKQEMRTEIEEEISNAKEETKNEMNSEIEEKITNSKNEVKNDVKKEVYPVGSIYTSINKTDPGTLFGGKWVQFGIGRNILSVSTNEASEREGGSNQVTLNVGNLPAHSHTYNQVNSATGSHTLSATEIPSHTHTYAKANTPTGGTAITVAQMPSHTHYSTNYNIPVWGTTTPDKKGLQWVATSASQYWGYTTASSIITATGGNQAHTHPITTTNTATTATGGSQGHTHPISTTSANTGNTGSGSAFSVQNAYITVYMWKRIE